MMRFAKIRKGRCYLLSLALQYMPRTPMSKTPSPLIKIDFVSTLLEKGERKMGAEDKDVKIGRKGLGDVRVG